MKAKLIRIHDKFHVTLGETMTIIGKDKVKVNFNFVEKLPYVVNVDDNGVVTDIIRQLKTTDHKKYVCSICGELVDSYLGLNSAFPVNTSRCCDSCNVTIVVPARLNRMR